MADRRAPAAGKQLEELVATIEGLLLPRGFDVKKNTRVYNDNGVQIAEFDIEIRSKLGSGEIAWLIECRDRPGDGPAPGAWIEQLASRRSRFKFNKVTAVSTTGFAEGAIEYAKEAGIDLRAVEEIAPELVGWLRVGTVIGRQSCPFLYHADLVIAGEESPETTAALQAALASAGTDPLNAPILRTITGVCGTIAQAFTSVVVEHPEVWDDVVPNQEGKPVLLNVNYEDQGQFVLESTVGPLRVARIVFHAVLIRKEVKAPLDGVQQYRAVGSEGSISQSAGFTVPFGDMTIDLKLHRLVESGETHITVRRVDEKLTSLQ